jgi:adenosylcobinamide-GDP ribazoletransferase
LKAPVLATKGSPFFCATNTTMQKEIKIFLAAVMFLTRLPVPKNIDHSEALLQKTPKYFPLVGWLVALLGCVPFFFFQQFVSLPLAVLALMITNILTTGAFHEDGFADVCDAFGGGWTKEKILAIMKDSRLGTYGVTGLVFMLAAKFLLLSEIATAFSLHAASAKQFYLLFVAMFAAAHSSSRLMPVLIIQLYEYVTSDDGSKSKPLASKKISAGEFIVSVILAFLPFVFLPFAFLLSFVFIVPVIFLLANYFKRWIGGYTGDCLGAAQQVSEIIFYLSVLMIWKYI